MLAEDPGSPGAFGKALQVLFSRRWIQLMHEYGFELCGSHYPWGFFQLAAQFKRELFKGQLCGWESPYAEGQLVF